MCIGDPGFSFVVIFFSPLPNWLISLFKNCELLYMHFKRKYSNEWIEENKATVIRKDCDE